MMRETEFEVLMRVPDELYPVHAELENWGIWSRDGVRRSHCASIEHKYQPEPCGDPEPCRIGPTSLKAAALHPHVCALGLRYRWLLQLWYVHRAPIGFIRRKLGLTRDALPTELNRARRMLANRVRLGVGFAPTT